MATAAAATPRPQQAPPPPPQPDSPAQTEAEAETGANLPELWQQILAGLALPSTRMLLSQQAQLVRLDQKRAVVRVAGNWMAMVQSRQALLEQAIHQALGSPRQLVLEGGGQATMPDAAAPVPQPVASAPRPEAPQTAPQVAASVAPAVAPAVAPPTQERAPAPSGAIDAKAQRLAEFFNGEVVSFDGELDDNPGPDSQAA